MSMFNALSNGRSSKRNALIHNAFENLTRLFRCPALAWTKYSERFLALIPDSLSLLKQRWASRLSIVA